MLLGRDAELNYLEQFYQQNGSQLLVVYGQKNVGTTSLLRIFCQEKDHFFYMARSCSEREQRSLLSYELEQFKISNLKKSSTYTELFSTMTKLSSYKKIIVIEEFQYIIKTDSVFLTELLAFMKNPGKFQDVLIILSSSSIDYIENSLKNRMGDAEEEIAGFLKVKELPFRYLAEHYSNYSQLECLEVYSVLGGFPGLWSHFSKELSFRENVVKNLIPTGSFLFKESLNYVLEDLRETSVYNTILASLAMGKKKLNDLSLITGFSRAKISVYLKNLINLELVEKIFSYDTDGKSNVQKGIYRIQNPLVHFYFRFLYPHLSLLWEGNEDVIFDQFIAPSFRFFVQPSLQKMCLEQLNMLNSTNQLPIHFEQIGEWVGKIGTIDIVAQDCENKTLIAMCNYENPVMTYDDYEWLIFLTKKAKLKPDFIFLYSISGFDDKLIQEAGTKIELQLINLC